MSIFSQLSNLSRARKLELFYQIFSPTSEQAILDIGAEINPDNDRGLQFIDTYPWKENITAVNLSDDHIEGIKKHYPQVKAIVADACDLPWPDKHFDIVYSNAVIEHVGDLEKQKKMAAEIMRVSKSWFVTTPNRYYPFEFHLRLPLVTWLPFNAYTRIGHLLRYDHNRRKYVFNGPKPDFRLMNAKQLRELFPTGKVICQSVTFMPETLINFARNH